MELVSEKHKKKKKKKFGFYTYIIHEEDPIIRILANVVHPRVAEKVDQTRFEKILNCYALEVELVEIVVLHNDGFRKTTMNYGVFFEIEKKSMIVLLN